MSRARDASRLSNSNIFTVGPTNNVGVGSTTPDVKLDVQDGTIEAGSFIGPLTGNVTSNQINVGSAITIRSSDNVARFGTNASIAANTGVVIGSVFIGDGSGLTNVVGSGSSGIIVKSGGVTVGTASTIDFADNITVSQISAGICTVRAIADSSVNYWPKTSVGIHTLGNVGVGTTNPTSTLTVEGSVNLIGIVTVSNLRSPNVIITGVSTFGSVSINSSLSTINIGSGVTIKTTGIDVYSTAINSSGMNVSGIVTATAFNGVGVVPTGAVFHFASQYAPSGYLICNGDIIPFGIGTVQGITADFTALYTVIGNTYGSSGALPDLRGEFIRGWDNARGADTGRLFGSFQSWAIQNITSNSTGHNRTDFGAQPNGASAYTADGISGLGGGGVPYRGVSFDASRVVQTANETRPRNLALLPCIKY
jgi:Phage Tail Collar Domain